ncbi:actin depolymerizing protein [Artomyces pyxidatus]|uniref:Actin depolymerizing protein n=1 Tax=Artomyces pyxidatus TaxID=48021 RepID=A0ACB8TAQ6_9AGAM|nr:actin depolymerizing protein [Artomyces pyxidatus]
MRTDHPESSDPEIRKAYRAVVQDGSLNWLLLGYGKWSSGLKLLGSGSQGLPDLKGHIPVNEVCFAFCRENVDGTPFFITIAYIPERTSGLRRARALVTSRTVQSWFRAQQAILTGSRLEDLTSDTLAAAVHATCQPQDVHTEPIIRSSSDHYDTEKALPAAPSAGPVRRAQSEGPVGGPSTLHPQRPFPPDFGSPAERARRRMEHKMHQEAEEREAERQEAARQARIKAEKAEMLRRFEEEEHRRRISLEDELHRVAEVRAQREEDEREEEHERAMQKEAKRQADLEKRLVETRRLQEYRREEQRRSEELAQQEAESRRVAEDKRRRARSLADQVRREKAAAGASVLLNGWVSIQVTDSVVWRRRHFQLDNNALKLFKNEKEVNLPLETIKLKGCVRSVNEWNEGFEELRAIPHSFALVFGNGRETMFMYTDSELDKDV